MKDHWNSKVSRKVKPPARQYVSFNVAVPPEHKDRLRLLFQRANLVHREQAGDSKVPMWQSIELILLDYLNKDLVP